MRAVWIPSLALVAAGLVCLVSTPVRAAPARAAQAGESVVHLDTAAGTTALGALVSRDGLIWTTRKAIAVCAETLAARADLDAVGFVARSFDDEMPCTGLEARLVDANGVSARLGDVRVVFVPELQIADLGGVQARVSFPRGTLDVVLLRAWDGARPVRGHRFLAVSARGPVDGDAVLAPGHEHAHDVVPSLEEIRAERDVLLPMVVTRLGALVDALTPLAARADAAAQSARRELRVVEIARARAAGRLALLRDPVRVAEAQRLQDTQLLALRGSAVDARDARGDAAAAAILSMENAWRRAAALMPMADALGAMGPHGPLWSLAGTVARGGDELAALDVAHLPAAHVDLEIARLAWGLESLRLAAPRDPLVESTLRGKSAKARAEEIVRSSALADPARRDAYLAAARASGKPGDDALVALRARWDARERIVVDELTSALFVPLGAARRALTARPGDAGGIATGTVRGGAVDGVHVHWAVTVGELFAWDRRAQGAAQRALPPRWREALSRVDFSVPLVLQLELATASVHEGGPLVGADGPASELVVGVLLGTQGAALADDLLPPRGDGRAVAITSNGLLHALDRVYDAKHLVDELLSSAADR
jgi:Peptidase S46